MNIDLDSQIQYGDTEGLRQFFLTHRFVHAQTALAISQQFSIALPSIGLASGAAEDAWSELMTARINGESRQPTQPLLDWLNLHAQLHQHEYSAVSPSLIAPDLSTVNFNNEEQFNEWMQAHQQMHDAVSQSLGINS
jgi:hypothetical protein